jgi:alpha-tubulin suppressor-like RCC1 family protein
LSISASRPLITASPNAINFACGVQTNGGVVCWGDNTYGQLNAPAGTFVAVSAGDDFACGMHSDGTIACWGANNVGQSTPPSGTFRLP